VVDDGTISPTKIPIPAVLLTKVLKTTEVAVYDFIETIGIDVVDAVLLAGVTTTELIEVNPALDISTDCAVPVVTVIMPSQTRTGWLIAPADVKYFTAGLYSADLAKTNARQTANITLTEKNNLAVILTVLSSCSVGCMSCKYNNYNFEKACLTQG